MNERAFYKRTCDLCGASMISNFSPTAPFPVYCNPCWTSDKWDPMSYGMDVDFSKPFFLQMKDLHELVPWQALHTVHSSMINSEYAHNASYLKDCYLMSTSDYSENCMYGTCVEHSKDSLDLLFADAAEACYDSTNLTKCNRVFYSVNCSDSYNLMYCKNCIGCGDCFGSTNLRNKQYYISNQPYSKEAYLEKIKELSLGSFTKHLEYKKMAQTLAATLPRRFMTGTMNANVSGEYISNCKNTHESYQVMDAQDCKYCHLFILGPTKDCYDFTMWGMNASLVYESTASGGGTANCKFVSEVWTEAHDIEYCFNLLLQGSNLFGCNGIKQKEYCILNKQYSKDEYIELVSKIKEHMMAMPYIDKHGHEYKYGEFFPPEFSPFAYNETLAQEYFPLTKEQALAQDRGWRDREAREYKITLASSDIPDSITEVDESVTKQIIECFHKGTCNHQCSEAFRIIPKEFEFYKKYNLPLPRLCPNCRHYGRLSQKQGFKLYKRACAKCDKEIETSYSPDRPEIVYCERCYNTEVV